MTLAEDKRRSPRVPVRANLRFRPIAKVTEGSTVDLSSDGMQIETTEPLRVILAVVVGKETEKHVAKLIWARRTPSGAMRYGFAFDAAAEEELRCKSENGGQR